MKIVDVPYNDWLMACLYDDLWRRERQARQLEMARMTREARQYFRIRRESLAHLIPLLEAKV